MLIGWASGIEELKSILPGMIAMLPNAAVAFILSGAALALGTLEHRPKAARIATRVLAGLVGAIGLLTIIERLGNVNLGIDLVLFRDAVIRTPWQPPGRMAINSALSFCFVAVTLLLIDHVTPRGRRLPDLFAGFTLLIAYLALVGHGYGVGALYNVGQFTGGMALLTAIVLLVLGIGLLIARPDRGVAALITSHEASGLLTRRLLPAGLIIPLALGGVWIRARQEEWVTREVGVSLFVILVTATFVMLVIQGAGVARVLEKQRERSLARERRARGEAESANRAKMEFLTNMSHELRTPLNAIAGYAELLELEIHGPVSDTQREVLSRIRRSQRHLLSLINDVLNFAKLEAGRVEFRLEDISVHEILEGLESLILPQLQAKEMTYEYVRCDAGILVRTDAEKMRQTLLNLLSNAVKFTDPGGQIRLWCETGPQNVQVHVSDTGHGIPPDRLESIFEPFVQIQRGLTHTTEGTGLGLAISRDLARGMGGDLTVESAVGKGSTFTLTVPRAGAALRPPRGTPTRETSGEAQAVAEQHV